MAVPRAQAADLPDHPFPRTHAFIQLVRARVERNDIRFDPLFLALHQLNATITMNEVDDIDEAVLVAQFAAVTTEGMNLSAAILDAYNAFRLELETLIEQVHLINDPPPQDGRNTMLATAAGGALITIGALAAGPALAIGVLEVLGLGSIVPVVGMSVMHRSLSEGN
ncbi:hypothetical protein FRC01_008034 [Tulasnella sp. 417]|nr:hypothetical protein FRC01_008034 [Tulasnella sp. 417]